MEKHNISSALLIIKKTFRDFIPIRIIILFTFHFSLLTIYSQPVTQEWVRTYNGPYNDNDQIRGMTLDRFSNIYITGRSIGNNGGDIVTIKYNTAGVQNWVKIYSDSTTTDEYPSEIAVDSLGNVYVIGISFYNFNPIYYLFFKYNSNGDLQWLKKFSYSVMGSPHSICIDKANFIYISGYDGTSAMVTKYNSNGDSLWIRKYTESGRISSAGKILTNDSNLYICGFSEQSFPLNDDFLTLKYDANGNFKWAVKYTGPQQYGLDEPYDIDIDKFGNVIVTGLAAFGGAPRYDDYVTVKYNWNGVQQWVALYNGPGSYYDNAYALKTDGNGNILVTGGSYYGPAQGGYNITTIKYNNDGDSLWVKDFTGSGNNEDVGNDLAIDDSGNVYLTGKSTGIGCITIKYNPYGIQSWIMPYSNSVGNYIGVDDQKNVYVAGTKGGLNVDLLTIKYSQLVGIKPLITIQPNKHLLSQNYPNPFNPKSNIKFQIAKSGDVKLTVFDVLGREIAVLVNQELAHGTYEVDWDGSNYPSGVYFYKLDAGDFTQTKKMVLLK